MNLLDQLTAISDTPLVRRDRAGRKAKKDKKHTFVEGSNTHMAYKLLSGSQQGKGWTAKEVADTLGWTEVEAKSAIRHLCRIKYISPTARSGRHFIYRLRDTVPHLGET